MFFLSLETSTVAFRNVLAKLLSFLSCLDLDILSIFFSEIFLWFFVCFLAKFPQKFPPNSYEIGHFLHEFVSINLVKFDLFLQIIRSPVLMTISDPLQQKTQLLQLIYATENFRSLMKSYKFLLMSISDTLHAMKNTKTMKSYKIILVRNQMAYSKKRENYEIVQNIMMLMTISDSLQQKTRKLQNPTKLF